jgi:hypothetical protein
MISRHSGAAPELDLSRPFVCLQMRAAPRAESPLRPLGAPLRLSPEAADRASSLETFDLPKVMPALT